MSSLDDYLTTLDPAQRNVIERVYFLVKQVVPDIEHGVSYGMPALLYRGKPVVSVVARKNFLSLYPFSGKIIEGLRVELNGYEVTKGSIHLSEATALSASLLTKIVAMRLQEIDGLLGTAERPSV